MRRFPALARALSVRLLLLRGLVGEAGGRILRGEMEGVASEAEMLGVRLAEYLIGQGAEELLGAAS